MSVKFLLRFVSYYFSSKSVHDAHSNFLFNFIRAVFLDVNPYPDYDIAKNYRKQLLNDVTLISSPPLGAKPQLKTSSIAQLTEATAKQHRYAKVLYLLIQYCKPKNIIELGTATGVSALYQALARPSANVHTLDGNIQLLEIVKDKFAQMNIKNVEFIPGVFDKTFPALLNKLQTVDYIFFDGNHTYDATIKYFETALPYIHNKTIFIFDDINWSNEMQRAWKEICAHSSTTLCIDIFMMGIVLFDKSLAKQTFVYRY